MPMCMNTHIHCTYVLTYRHIPIEGPGNPRSPLPWQAVWLGALPGSVGLPLQGKELSAGLLAAGWMLRIWEFAKNQGPIA